MVKTPTINALTAANSVIIPVQTHYLPAKGMAQLVQTIQRVKKHINPALRVDGVLLTMTDGRTNISKEIAGLLRSEYGNAVHVFDTEIPFSVKFAEACAAGLSIYEYAQKQQSVSVIHFIHKGGAYA